MSKKRTDMIGNIIARHNHLWLIIEATDDGKPILGVNINACKHNIQTERDIAALQKLYEGGHPFIFLPSNHDLAVLQKNIALIGAKIKSHTYPKYDIRNVLKKQHSTIWLFSTTKSIDGKFSNFDLFNKHMYEDFINHSTSNYAYITPFCIFDKMEYIYLNA